MIKTLALFLALTVPFGSASASGNTSECSTRTYQDMQDTAKQENFPMENLLTLDGLEIVQAFIKGVEAKLGPPPWDLSKSDKVLIVRIPDDDQAIVVFFVNDCKIGSASLFNGALDSILKEAKKLV